jgi:ubiquinone/menaquinone biosynthesis C-methylase UbiE
MGFMAEDHSHSAIHGSGHRHDYLPAAGLHMLLPVYDLLTRVLGSARVYDAVTGRPELTGARRVLEIGCGTGNLIQRVRKAHPSAQLTGLDPDPRALDIARRKAGSVPGLVFDQGYAQELPYADGAFDRVLSSMMLHHLDDPAKAAAVAEVFRVLEPGGMVLVADIRASDETITRLLHDAGFEHRVIGETRLRVFGPVVLHRGTRPA